MPWRIVDDEKHLPWSVFGDELFEEAVEGCTVEDLRKSVGEFRFIQTDGRKDVSGQTLTVSINARLFAYARPGVVERSVEPEAGFILE